MRSIYVFWYWELLLSKFIVLILALRRIVFIYVMCDMEYMVVYMSNVKDVLWGIEWWRKKGIICV